MSEHDGGPAFPTSAVSGISPGYGGASNGQFPGAIGMSLRDWFAGQALAGLIADGKCGAKAQTVTDAAQILAKAAYAVADEMITERVRWLSIWGPGR